MKVACQSTTATDCSHRAISMLLILVEVFGGGTELTVLSPLTYTLCLFLAPLITASYRCIVQVLDSKNFIQDPCCMIQISSCMLCYWTSCLICDYPYDTEHAMIVYSVSYSMSITAIIPTMMLAQRIGGICYGISA